MGAHEALWMPDKNSTPLLETNGHKCGGTQTMTHFEQKQEKVPLTATFM